MRVGSKEDLFRKIERFLEEKENIRTELKIIFVNVKDDFNFKTKEDFSKFLCELAETHYLLKRLLSKYNIILNPIENNFYKLDFMGIRNKERVEFYILKRNNFLEIYTWEKIERVDRTLTRLIKYLPWSYAWISPRELEEFVLRTLGEDSIQGFTSKSSQYGIIRKGIQKIVTIRVWGGDLQDLKNAREHFNAEPTRIDNKIVSPNPGTVLDSTIITKGMVSIRAGSPIDVFSHKEASFTEFKEKERRYKLLEQEIQLTMDEKLGISGIELPPIPNIRIKISDFWDENKFNKFKNYLLYEDPHITGFEIEKSGADGSYSLMLSDFLNAGDFQLVAYPKEKEFVIYPFKTSRRENLKLLFEKIVMNWDPGAKLIVDGG